MQEELDKLMHKFITLYPILGNPGKRGLLETSLFAYLMMVHIKKQLMNFVDTNAEEGAEHKAIVEFRQLQKDYRDFHATYRTGLQKLGLVSSKQKTKPENPQNRKVMTPAELLEQRGMIEDKVDDD